MTRGLSTIRPYVTPATVGTLLHFNELLQVLVTTQPTTPYPLEFVCGLSLPRPPPKHRNTETPPVPARGSGGLRTALGGRGKRR